MIDIKKVKRFFEQEIRSLELAPKINGCEMTEDWKEQIEICKMSISALEKQIPKKPIKHGFDPNALINSVSYTCPVCGKHIGRDKFCKHCSQALDWSDTE